MKDRKTDEKQNALRNEYMQKILHELVLELNSCMDLHSGMDMILKALLNSEYIDGGGIYVTNPIDNSLDLKVHHGLSKEFIERVSHYSADSPQALLARKGEPLYGTYAEIRLETDNSRENEGLKAFAVIPVMSLGRLVAVLNIMSRRHDSIPAETRSFLETIAFQTGNTVLRFRTDAALRESENKFYSYIESSPNGIFVLDNNGRCIDANKSACRMTGYSKEEIVNMSVKDFLTEESIEKWRAVLKQLMEAGTATSELWYKNKSGLKRCLSFDAVKLSETRALCFSDDISDHKKIEKDIELFQEKLRALTSKLSLVEEQERRRIAAYLHDNISQQMAIAALKLAKIHESRTIDRDSISSVRKLIEESLNTMRSLTFELSPPILYDLGFEAAVEWLAELMQEQHGIEFKVQRNMPVSIVQEDRVILFRCTREILYNIVKHAQATLVHISINAKGGRLYIVIEDNGIGFDINSNEKNTSFGLFSVRVQMENLNGGLTLESIPGMGTKAVITYPLKNGSPANSRRD